MVAIGRDKKYGRQVFPKNGNNDERLKTDEPDKMANKFLHVSEETRGCTFKLTKFYRSDSKRANMFQRFYQPTEESVIQLVDEFGKLVQHIWNHNQFLASQTHKPQQSHPSEEVQKCEQKKPNQIENIQQKGKPRSQSPERDNSLYSIFSAHDLSNETFYTCEEGEKSVRSQTCPNDKSFDTSRDVQSYELYQQEVESKSNFSENRKQNLTTKSQSKNISTKMSELPISKKFSLPINSKNCSSKTSNTPTLNGEKNNVKFYKDNVSQENRQRYRQKYKKLPLNLMSKFGMLESEHSVWNTKFPTNSKMTLNLMMNNQQLCEYPELLPPSKRQQKRTKPKKFHRRS